ncbi:unnamed protein product [Arabidopsis lyrata]|nr:unnamed protein product [Arabidopsis lyrata]
MVLSYRKVLSSFFCVASIALSRARLGYRLREVRFMILCLMLRSIFHQPCVSFIPSRPLCIWFHWNTEISFIVIFLYKRMGH